MATKRMFALTIVDSDAFLEMPTSTRLLYFDLGMRADDDGFVNSPKKILKFTGASEDDLKLLITKKFIIPFDNGVVVIKHWRINNTIRKDLYTETKYKEERASLYLDENNAYSLHPPENWLTIKNRNGYVTSTDTQSSLDQIRLDKNSISQSIIDSLTDEEFESLQKQVVSDGFIELIDKLETVDAASVKKPYAYCLKVAKEIGVIKP